MNLSSRLIPAVCTGLALLGLPVAASAQECSGIPGGRGYLSVGFEGTDGATGQGVGFAYRAPAAAMVLQHRSLNDISLADDRRTSEVQFSTKVPAVRLPVCLVAGAQSTAYDNSFHESTSWGEDPGYRTERHRMGGAYRSFRVPLGVSAGREFRVSDRLSLIPFVQPLVVLERESLQPATGPLQTRSDWGLGASGGITAALDWVVLRSTVTHASAHEYALSSQHNWPVVSLHAGVRF